MDAFLTSTTIVTLAEIGDKTQLLAILLATRFRAPLPIILGIFAATIANHFLAALLGASVASLLDGDWFRYLIAASFIAMAAWTLVPDKVDDLDDKPARFGAFSLTKSQADASSVHLWRSCSVSVGCANGPRRTTARISADRLLCQGQPHVPGSN